MRDVSCETVREILSSRLDGEDGPPTAFAGVDPAAVALAGIDAGMDADAADRHVAVCATCAAWLAGAERLHRAVRVRPADDVPDLTRAVLSGLVEQGLVRPWAEGSRAAAKEHRAKLLRVVLLALASVQVLSAVANLVGALSGRGHASSDEGAFELAVAVMIGWAAFRPQVARAVTVLALPLAGCLVLTAVVGMVRGVTAPHLEAHHLLTIATSGLAIALAHTTPSAPSAPARGRLLAA